MQENLETHHLAKADTTPPTHGSQNSKVYSALQDLIPDILLDWYHLRIVVVPIHAKSGNRPPINDLPYCVFIAVYCDLLVSYIHLVTCGKENKLRNVAPCRSLRRNLSILIEYTDRRRGN